MTAAKNRRKWAVENKRLDFNRLKGQPNNEIEPILMRFIFSPLDKRLCGGNAVLGDGPELLAQVA